MYKKNATKDCYDYQPIGCLDSTRLECQVNADGCRTCNCVPWN